MDPETPKTDQQRGAENCAAVKNDALVLLEMAEALKNLPAEAQARVLRALAVFYGVRLTP